MKWFNELIFEAPRDYNARQNIPNPLLSIDNCLINYDHEFPFLDQVKNSRYDLQDCNGFCGAQTATKDEIYDRVAQK